MPIDDGSLEVLALFLLGSFVPWGLPIDDPSGCKFNLDRARTEFTPFSFFFLFGCRLLPAPCSYLLGAGASSFQAKSVDKEGFC